MEGRFFQLLDENYEYGGDICYMKEAYSFIRKFRVLKYSEAQSYCILKRF